MRTDAKANAISQAVFVASNAAENLTEIKNASFRTLAAFSAAFGFMIAQADDYPEVLCPIFFLAGTLCLVMVGIVYPGKLAHRRRRLDDAYNVMPFAKHLRGLCKIQQKDAGDYLYEWGGTIYIALLLAIYLKAIP